jgi:hypothetical protein
MICEKAQVGANSVQRLVGWHWEPARRYIGRQEGINGSASIEDLQQPPPSVVPDITIPRDLVQFSQNQMIPIVVPNAASK